MAVYLVSYDLETEGQNYTELLKLIRSMVHCNPQKSMWFVEYDGDAIKLRDYLKHPLDENDRMFIAPIVRGWCSRNMPNCAKWLEDRGL